MDATNLPEKSRFVDGHDCVERIIAATGGVWYFTPAVEQVLKICGSNSMVECQLPKLDVAGSSPVSRSIVFIQI